MCFTIKVSPFVFENVEYHWCWTSSHPKSNKKQEHTSSRLPPKHAGKGNGAQGSKQQSAPKQDKSSAEIGQIVMKILDRRKRLAQ
ncbi:hypothetical protein RCL_jg18617.t1 [Rhizophagus clarus]|uniref:Uncharacterized protein n=1 Tax=Rhizophagus clarus TaxID=94130 RepID=A0A8H3QP05_9GLOM|nr:hypothetical protein RCL_jg18617.t1 [Rhizophagus clarus]